MSDVEIVGVGKSYGATPVLDDVSLRFAEGRFTSLLGPSGSGKTTLLRLIGGFAAPDRGRVLIGGEDVTAVPLWRRRIGMVFQSYALFPHMTVGENVAYGLRRQGLRGGAVRDAVARALALVELTGFEDRRPKQLSGGQQQRVALARAIVIKPRVLLLDEPLSALDRRLRQSMQVELKRIQRETGLTTIFVTHDQEEALSLSDHLVILDQGRVVQEGEPREVYERPRSLFAAGFLGEANVFQGIIKQGAVHTAFGPIRSINPLPNDGTVVHVLIRPEYITLFPLRAGEGGSTLNVVDVSCAQVTYAGATSTYGVETADGTRLTVQLRNDEKPALKIGNSVRLAWTVEQTTLIEG